VPRTREAPDPTDEHQVRQRALVVIAVCVGLAVMASVPVLHDQLVRANTVVEGVMRRSQWLGPPLFLLLSALSAMLAFFSSALLVPAAVPTWGATVTVLLLWIGWTVGGALAYGVSRAFGRPLVQKLVSGGWLERVEQRVGPDTPWHMVLLLQLALPSEVPGYLMGLVRYPFVKYLAALMLAELPFAIGTVMVGTSVLESRSVVIMGFGMAAVGVSWFAWRAFHRSGTDVPR
jgi:uncharacterized membrane protein YdjX (TVP38/TMEM64 family)